VFKDLTRVEFTNLEKILYPEPKITKGQVIEYYVRVAPKLLGLLEDRPLVMTRFPDGVDREGFYEKDAPLGTPSWVETYRRYSESSQRELSYVVCNNLDTLVWLANLAAIEIHMTLSRVGSYESPDLVLFDVDPKAPAGFDEAVEVALLLKDVLAKLAFRSFVKTSGKKGLHVVVPLVAGYTYEQTRNFVHRVAQDLAKKSKMVVSEFVDARKSGVVFIDYRQNSEGRTMVCPYSLRATPEATVSTPLSWDSLGKKIKPSDFTLLTLVKKQDNPWKELFSVRHKLEV